MDKHFDEYNWSYLTRISRFFNELLALGNLIALIAVIEIKLNVKNEWINTFDELPPNDEIVEWDISSFDISDYEIYCYSVRSIGRWTKEDGLGVRIWHENNTGCIMTEFEDGDCNWRRIK